MTPGTSRATASITTSAAASPPASTKSPTESSPSHEVVGHPLVDALVAAAEQREPVAGGELARPRLVEASAAGADSSSSGRGGSAASTAAKIGSGAMTMPAPPPNGVSSTVRCRSVGVVAQVVHPQVEPARGARPPEQGLRRADPRATRGRS